MVLVIWAVSERRLKPLSPG